MFRIRVTRDQDGDADADPDADMTRPRSWENGTLAQALIESDHPQFSPFNPSHTPPPSTPSLRQSVPDDIISLARVTLENRPTGQNAETLDDPFRGGRLLEDGSSADPASLGIAVYLAGQSESVGGDVIGGVDYETAAREEVEYQLYNVPRVSPLLMMVVRMEKRETGKLIRRC